MRQCSISGRIPIGAGIDCSYWDPSTDGALPHMYSPSSLAGKVQDKESLLQETGLVAGPDRPLFVMVSRLVAQKGVDLVLGAFDQMMSLPINPVSYTHLRAHETRHDLVCRLLLEKK